MVQGKNGNSQSPQRDVRGRGGSHSLVPQQPLKQQMSTVHKVDHHRTELDDYHGQVSNCNRYEPNPFNPTICKFCSRGLTAHRADVIENWERANGDWQSSVTEGREIFDGDFFDFKCPCPNFMPLKYSTQFCRYCRFNKQAHNLDKNALKLYMRATAMSSQRLNLDAAVREVKKEYAEDRENTLKEAERELRQIMFDQTQARRKVEEMIRSCVRELYMSRQAAESSSAPTSLENTQTLGDTKNSGGGIDMNEEENLGDDSQGFGLNFMPIMSDKEHPPHPLIHLFPFMGYVPQDITFTLRPDPKLVTLDGLREKKKRKRLKTRATTAGGDDGALSEGGTTTVLEDGTTVFTGEEEEWEEETVSSSSEEEQERSRSPFSSYSQVSRKKKKRRAESFIEALRTLPRQQLRANLGVDKDGDDQQTKERKKAARSGLTIEQRRENYARRFYNKMKENQTKRGETIKVRNQRIFEKQGWHGLPVWNSVWATKTRGGSVGFNSSNCALGQAVSKDTIDQQEKERSLATTNKSKVDPSKRRESYFQSLYDEDFGRVSGKIGSPDGGASPHLNSSSKSPHLRRGSLAGGPGSPVSELKSSLKKEPSVPSISNMPRGGSSQQHVSLKSPGSPLTKEALDRNSARYPPPAGGVLNDWSNSLAGGHSRALSEGRGSSPGVTLKKDEKLSDRIASVLAKVKSPIQGKK